MTSDEFDALPVGRKIYFYEGFQRLANGPIRTLHHRGTQPERDLGLENLYEDFTSLARRIETDYAHPPELTSPSGELMMFEAQRIVSSFDYCTCTRERLIAAEIRSEISNVTTKERGRR